MNRNYAWKAVIILFLTVLCIAGMYPPVGQNLIEVFKQRASPGARDATFTNIVTEAERLQKQFPERTFANLREAVGTNYITNYFPRISVAGKKDPTRHVLQRLQQDTRGKFRLGLDLQGGTSFLVEMQTSALSEGQTNGIPSQQRQESLERAIEVLRTRVDKLGVAEPVIQPSGDNRILIQLPGLAESDKQQARENIQKAAFLEFRLVHPESDKLLAQNIIEPGYEILRMEEKVGKGKQTVLIPYLVKKRAERGLTGKYLKRALPSRHHVTGQPNIEFELDAEGAKLFADITRAHEKERLAIVLDGELYSAPVIEEPIEGGRGVISGNFDPKEANNLANILENPLEAPVSIVEERAVDPSLGRDAISSGVTAAVVGTILVLLFMLFFYFFAGMVANFALTLNVLITLGIMCWMKATLTLPGIAGLVLSIGMAVDANVLIFERIREELAVGKSLRGALAAGYHRAFGTILDSHVTTLISAGILIKMGTGPIQGFGVMLTIGVAASLFTALLVTRLVFDFLLARNLMKTLRMMPILKLTKVDFVAFTRPAMIISALIIIGGLGYGIFGRGEKMMGVDFAGGDSLTFQFAQKVDDVEKIRASISKLGIGEPTIQYQKPISGGRETLQILTAFNAEKKVEAALKNDFPQASFQLVGTDKVGPSVGKEIQRSAIISALLAMLGILFYVAVRYEFSFAVAAVVATTHDVLLTMAVFAVMGGELSSTVVAAILTILGYSINDKIVILDRIREDLKLGVRGSFREVINLALNQTLSRTLITGGSVILATLALYIFGGGVIKDFAFVFLTGILVGTYSSIYIASAVLLAWNKGERPRLGAGSSVRVENPITSPSSPSPVRT
jgi:SecD/SecF fusion protein